MEIGQKHLDDPALIESAIETFSKKSSFDASDTSYLPFAHAIAHHFPLADWLGRPLNDFLNAFRDFHRFVSVRCDNEWLIKVYNPSVELNGWECGHTVVLVNCKDMPFVIDSVRMVLEEKGYAIHLSKSTVIDVTRKDGSLLEAELHEINDTDTESDRETVAYFEISSIVTEGERSQLQERITEICGHIEHVVNDYDSMMARVKESIEGLGTAKKNAETRAFLEWLSSSHFTFLGFRELTFNKPLVDGLDGDHCLEESCDSRLGIFRALKMDQLTVSSNEFVRGAEAFYSSDNLICFSKSATRSTVHRRVYPDYVVVKRFDESGATIGEWRFMGFYTYSASAMAPENIPLVRLKVATIFQRFGFSLSSHDGKRLARIIDLHPKEELFQSSTEELYDCVKKVFELNERDVLRLIVRQDDFGQFVSCFVYVPRELYNTSLREKIQSLIGYALNSEDADVTTFFSESKHIRAHLVFRLPATVMEKINLEFLERDIIEVALGWKEHFRKSLEERFGENTAALYYKNYADGIQNGYQDAYDARSAARDIEVFESLNDESSISTQLYQPLNTTTESLRFKVRHLSSMLELSGVIPILENMGLRVLGENPFRVQRKDGTLYWVHDFQLKSNAEIDLSKDELKTKFEQAFSETWKGNVESDSFNQLILVARLDWQQVAMLRSYAHYMKQTLFHLSIEYIAQTLVSFPNITNQLVNLFYQKFDPSIKATLEERQDTIKKIVLEIESELEQVDVLNDEIVLRRFIDLINGSTRVNFFQRRHDSSLAPYLATKFEPNSIQGIPEPRPAHEIFIYSSRVEGVHLRMAKVARGGLRWSDRLEDYRTEVLGLVKAQQVKNAVIVPSGAKGGFVAKRLPTDDRAKMFEEGVQCYRLFIRGLLDLTDNLSENVLLKPVNTVCWDEDDPYLVVAADKGTATFSDVANEISRERGHWLGDAFASGGSQGYDHKAMGITAKGAWISVQRHFREFGINVQEDPFTVVAIGDMGGDVFGNGMLCSSSLKLVAAFNHLHIFIDPNPDPEKSYEERLRLFSSKSAGWSDYNEELISEGGGVYSRNAKFITLTKEIKTLIQSDATKLTPTELISALLKAQVDLIWNGGIGTYIKSSEESHSDVGDKANDSLRVDGKDLNCRVFGEGGNLGMTQLGRVEFCLHGGACNTDFIDNSAGVDCSDHEVNIKILIDSVVTEGELTGKQRNALLREMTDDVSRLVLKNNYQQTLTLSVAMSRIEVSANEFRRFVSWLESEGRLNRELEYIPSNQDIIERIASGKHWTRPELSVLICYAKVQVKEALMNSLIADDDYCARSLFNVFPPVLAERYEKQITQHKLRGEIIATQLANAFINELGITALYRLLETTRADIEDIVRCFVIARNIFNFTGFVKAVSDLDYAIDAAEQYSLIFSISRRIRRATRWFVANRRRALDVGFEVEQFKEPLAEVQRHVSQLLEQDKDPVREQKIAKYESLGLDCGWYDLLTMPDNLFSGLAIVEVSITTSQPIKLCTEVFFELLDVLNLSDFATRLSAIDVTNYWQANAREGYISELEAQIRKLSVLVLNSGEELNAEETVASWCEQNGAAVERWKSVVKQVQTTQENDYAMFAVATKELSDLVEFASVNNE